MRETQESIAIWADAAFGVAPKLLRILARANEEMAELLRAVTSSKTPHEIATEAADVAIVLARVGKIVGNDLIALCGVQVRERNWNGAEVEKTATRANHMLSHAMLLTSYSEKEDPRPVFYLERTMIHLAIVVASVRLDLGSYIDAKMAVNRMRVWKRDGTGHGYHIRQDNQEIPSTQRGEGQGEGAYQAANSEASS
jgi:hypothetical protein